MAEKKTRTAKPSAMLLRYSVYRQTESMTNAQFGELVRLLLAYSIGRLPQRSDDIIVNTAYSILRVNIDEDTDKYEARCAVNAENAMKRYRKAAGEDDIA